jgi:four helix bundle protein
MSGELSFTKLKIWQRAHELTLEIYKITARFPQEEKFGLTSQLRRAAVSVESCIAEGHGRYYYADTVRFLRDAKGSIFEIQTQILIAKDLKYKGYRNFDRLINEYTGLTKQINSLISYKKRRKKRSS